MAIHYQAPEEKEDDTYYRNERGTLLRLGVGKIEIDRRKFLKKERPSWEEIKAMSLKKVRDYTYPLQIKDIEEFGILDRSFNMFRNMNVAAGKTDKPGKKFAGLVNQKLAMSTKKDIYIYVHGYNTVFEDPLLVAAELWHYMGYEGVFIAYSWPATPRGLVKDQYNMWKFDKNHKIRLRQELKNLDPKLLDVSKR